VETGKSWSGDAALGNMSATIRRGDELLYGVTNLLFPAKDESRAVNGDLKILITAPSPQ
jgi:hypothetical protein